MSPGALHNILLIDFEMEETKIIYYIDDEMTPYLVKLPIPPDRVTLSDFKNVLNRPNFKFFFKSMDDDFGVVKEEIVEDEAHLPCFNGRVVSWLVSADNGTLSDNHSQCADSVIVSDLRLPTERVGGIGDSRPPSFHANAPHDARAILEDDTCIETDSMIHSRRDQYLVHRSSRPPRYDKYNRYHLNGPHVNGLPKHKNYDTSSMVSSDLEATSFFDSEDDASSRITTATEHSSVSRIAAARHRRQRKKRHRMPPMSRTSSISSITDSTMSLNIITVTLNMDTVNFLGISIVGQSNKGGDGGIYVGSIMKGGAVALDGRVEPGDMILQVNDINFENMSNDEAVKVLREVVQKPGPIKLVVAKCWDPNPKGYFTIPRTEPVRPIDPGAWVAHTSAVRGDFPGRPPSVSTLTSTSSSITSSLPESERPLEELHLSVDIGMATIVKAMARPDSGLEIRDRNWLKITIPNAFIGADVVEWLHTHVEGFADRREARKFASHMLKAGYIRHTVNKITFSEQCYYVFGDVCSSFANLRIKDDEIISEVDRDTLAPLPPPTAPSSWGGSHMPYSGSYIPQIQGYAPMPFNYTNESISYSYNREGSLQSGSGGSSNGSRKEKSDRKSASPGGSGSDTESRHGGAGGSSGTSSERSISTVTSQQPSRPLDPMAREVSGSEDAHFQFHYTDKGIV